MIKQIRIFIAALSVVFAISEMAFAQSPFGRYLGVLKHAQLGQDQLAKLDFVVARQSSSDVRMIALLTLYFGDYNSPEYVTYHFDDVTYNVLTGALIFSQPDQEVSLIVERFSGGAFTGLMRSVSGGPAGVLEMTQKATVTPSRELIQLLSGEYRGTCNGKLKDVQIQTRRSNDDGLKRGNPFGIYEISAQLAEISPGFCMGPAELCVTRIYNDASYNFFTGKLDLVGRTDHLSCDVTGAGLTCGTCRFDRLSKERVALEPQSFQTYEGGFSLAKDPNPESAVDAAPAPLSGLYSGYLFHEKTGIYQAASLNIASYQGADAKGNPALFLSASSNLYFGDFKSTEFVSYRFQEREFPLLSPQIVLERISDDVDAVLQITQLGNGKVKGVWYSLLFGRIGTFELSSSSLPVLPSGSNLMSPLSGLYDGGAWKLNLQVIRESTPINTANPFYPLNFKGAFRLQEITPNIKITGGSYDFYTGKLSMALDDESFFLGMRPDQRHLLLKQPTPDVSRGLQSHQFKTFTKVNP